MINFTKDFDATTEHIIQKSLEVEMPILQKAENLALLCRVAKYMDIDFVNVDDAIRVAGNISFAALLAVEEAYLAGMKQAHEDIEKQIDELCKNTSEEA